MTATYRILSASLLAAGLLAAVQQSHADPIVIVKYEFPAANTFEPTQTDSNADAGNVNNTGSSSVLQTGAVVNDTLYYAPGANGVTSAASAVSSNRYFQFTVTPNTGYEFDLASLDIDATQIGVTAGARGWDLRSSIDSYATTINTQTLTTEQPSFASYSVNLSGAAYQNLSNAVTFRFYGFGPTNISGMIFDNMVLSGAVVSTSPVIPELDALASTGAFALLGFALALASERRRPAA